MRTELRDAKALETSAIPAGRATESVDRNYALIQELMKRFAEQFGATNCRVLIGCDLDHRRATDLHRQSSD